MCDEDISGSDYYEVIFNDCYGGFSFTHEFMDAVFERYPPDSEIGKDLFRSERCANFIQKGEVPNPEWNHYYVVVGKRPYVHGYSLLNIISYRKDKPSRNEKVDESHYVTKDDKIYYYTHPSSYEWRDIPEVIALGKEMDIFNKKAGFSLLRLEKVPKGYSYHINEYDGQEGVSYYIPFKPVIKELLDYIETRDESKLGEISRKLVSKKLSVYDVRW